MKMACYGDNVGSVATLCTSFSWLITSQSNTYGKVYNDNLKISQVLFNILDNALKFTAEGKVMVSAKMSSSSSSSSDVAAAAPSENTILTVSVSDTGVGIDSSIKNTLFEKFVSTSEIGAGIGLHLSRKIIEAHGGRIWAENNSDGNGATFAFNLPMLSEEK
jgi:signal transduction histidine kinase